MTRRRHGSGTIEPTRDGQYRLRVRVDGRKMTAAVAATKEELEAIADATLADLARGYPLRALRVDSATFVYFAQDGDATGAIKIGLAKNPAKRVLALQTGAPRKVNLLCVTRGGPALERALHAAFSGSRVSGEWFEPTKLLRQLIEELAPTAPTGSDR